METSYWKRCAVEGYHVLYDAYPVTRISRHSWILKMQKDQGYSSNGVNPYPWSFILPGKSGFKNISYISYWNNMKYDVI